MKARYLIYISIISAFLTGCASKKTVQTDAKSGATKIEKSSKKPDFIDKNALFDKVMSNASTAKAISSSVKLTLQRGQKTISVDGKLRMKRDEVIRIQITPMGLMEVARLELTPDYILIIDKMHNEYIQENYNEIDFLSSRGLDFYSIQALFWNELFQPGMRTITQNDLDNYAVNIDEMGDFGRITLKKDGIDYLWKALKTDGTISDAAMNHVSSTKGKTSLDWKYADFKDLQLHKFPAKQTIKFTNTAANARKEVTVTLQSASFDTSADWETTTQIKSKYKKVSAESVLKKLLSR